MKIEIDQELLIENRKLKRDMKIFKIGFLVVVFAWLLSTLAFVWYFNQFDFYDVNPDGQNIMNMQNDNSTIDNRNEM